MIHFLLIIGASYKVLIYSANIFCAMFLFSFMVGVKMSLSTVNCSFNKSIYFGFSKLLNLLAFAKSNKF